MEYTYNLAEIRGIIDGVLSDLNKRLTLDNKSEDSTQISQLAASETEFQPSDSGISAETGEKESGAIDTDHRAGQDSYRVVEVGAQESSDTDMAPVVDGSVAIATPPDQKLAEEEMSLKVVMTYYFYVDDSPEAAEKDNLAGSVDEKDSKTISDKVDFSEDSEKDSGAEYSSECDSCDFDADIDSVDDDRETTEQSYKLQSFSMMNIFDSVYDNNFDFTGSMDFGDGHLYRELVGSDSDKDTLDWLSNSSEDVLSVKQGEGIEREFEDPGEETFAAAEGEQDSSVAASANTTADTTVTTLDTTYKSYKGSTFSVSKCNSEIRQKLMTRLFRKVFPKKKYVVNKIK